MEVLDYEKTLGSLGKAMLAVILLCGALLETYLILSPVRNSRSIATRSKLMFHLGAQTVAQLRVSQLHQSHPRSRAKGEQPSVKDKKSHK